MLAYAGLGSSSNPKNAGRATSRSAGMVIDAALYPIDTYKTRTIQGRPLWLGAPDASLLERLWHLRKLWKCKWKGQRYRL